MSSQQRDDDQTADGARDGPERSRQLLDRTIELFAVHAAAVERFRLATIAFQAANTEFAEKQAVREQARAAREHAAKHREHVHAAVTRYVTDLRTIGTPPERMLVTLREHVTLVSRTTSSRIPSVEVQGLLTDVSAWAIKAYYAAA